MNEQEDWHLSGYEFKWNPKARVKFPKTFAETYPESSQEVIHQDNFELFLM